MARRVAGRTGYDEQGWATGVFYAGDVATGMAGTSGTRHLLSIDSGRTGPVGAANKPRGWGALACAFLGTPVTGS